VTLDSPRHGLCGETGSLRTESYHVSLDLDLADLGEGMPAITPAFGQMLAEAGAVCLDDCSHHVGVQLSVAGTNTEALSVGWPPVTPQMRACYHDPEEATEHGAYGIAILLIRRATGFAVVQRSRKGTGFDFWVGDDTELPFQNKVRLEVSGIRRGSTAQLEARVRQKVAQTSPTANTGLPAHIVVVEFSAPRCRLEVA